jgi:glucose-6-phosphate isomerase, archaeal
MRIIKPEQIHPYQGILEGKDVVKTKKYYKDIQSIYKEVDRTLALDTLMYEVYTVKEEQAYVGSLCWGLSVLYPVTVCGECNMTRGHFHSDLKCNEFYYGASGEGLLLLMNEDGTTYAEKVFEGSLHHIKGNQAHRLINTGDEVMKVICAWSSQAGHDYERIEKNPFQARIFKRNGKIEIEDLI